MSQQFAPDTAQLSGQNGGTSGRMFAFGANRTPARGASAAQAMAPVGKQASGKAAVGAVRENNHAQGVPSKLAVLTPQLQKKGLYAVFDFSCRPSSGVGKALNNGAAAGSSSVMQTIVVGQKEVTWSAEANADLVADKLAGPYKRANIPHANPNTKARTGHLLNELKIVSLYSNSPVGLSITPCRKDMLPAGQLTHDGKNFKLTPLTDELIIDQSGGTHSMIILPKETMAMGGKGKPLFAAEIDADNISSAFHFHNVNSAEEIDRECVRRRFGNIAEEEATENDYFREIPQSCGAAIDFASSAWPHIQGTELPSLERGYLVVPEKFFQVILETIDYAVEKQKARITNLQDLHLVLRRADGASFDNFPSGVQPNIRVETCLGLSYYDTADFNRKPSGEQGEQYKDIELPVSMKLQMLVDKMIGDNKSAVAKLFKQAESV